MQIPARPATEAIRLTTLHGLGVLDTAPDERFDRLTRLARRLLNVPIALVSLVDEERQWFKSCVGLSVAETSRSFSFCGHAILDDQVLLIADTRLDERFADNPLVAGAPYIRFYAGYPLAVSGQRVGTLCVIDQQPRSLAPEDLEILRDLGQLAEQELAAAQLAALDELTGLANRRGFFSLARHSFGACKKMAASAALLYFDLNDFKRINDRFGHAEGDRALIGFANLLRQTFRGADVIGRMGGDEFAALMPQAGRRAVSSILERLLNATAAWNDRERRGYELRYSVGTVVSETEAYGSVESLLTAADALMYARKRATRCDVT